MTQSNEEELRSFLVENIETYEELELLVLLRGESQGSQSVEQMALQLSIPEQLALDALDALVARGLLVANSGAKGRYQYAPGNPALHRGAGVLYDEYKRNRLHVIHLMTANAIERLRSSTLRTFADCFRVRGPKDNG
ncbi:MAG TPA: hypothetical protein VGI10_15805 [Polyangiaceae bacterium]